MAGLFTKPDGRWNLNAVKFASDVEISGCNSVLFSVKYLSSSESSEFSLIILASFDFVSSELLISSDFSSNLSSLQANLRDISTYA